MRRPLISTLRELRKRDAFARGREQANVFDGFFVVAIRRGVAHHQVVALLALQHLADRFPADRGFHRILNVRDVDAVARGGLAVDRNIQIGLAQDAEQAEVFDACARFS